MITTRRRRNAGVLDDILCCCCCVGVIVYYLCVCDLEGFIQIIYVRQGGAVCKQLQLSRLVVQFNDNSSEREAQINIFYSILQETRDKDYD